MRLPFRSAEKLVDGMCLLPGFVETQTLVETLHPIIAVSPPRAMTTPWGKPMSAHITNVGTVGWVSDRKGYRYSSHDPMTGEPWPSMPQKFTSLASEAAEHAGFENFTPDVCLINRYAIGSQMGAHQDNDEQDRTQPVVSISLGLSATFFFRKNRTGPSQTVELHDGDVLIFGGPMRNCYHGIKPIRTDDHPAWGLTRWNLTFRKAN